MFGLKFGKQHTGASATASLIGQHRTRSSVGKDPARQDLRPERAAPAAAREMAADQVITALLGAFDAQPSERAASQEALQGWEGMPGYVPLLLQLYAAPPPPR